MSIPADMILRVLLILAALAAVIAYVFVRARGHLFSSTKLQKHFRRSTGEVTRVYITRRNLRAKLWLQRTSDGFKVCHQGADADFTVTTPGNIGEAIYVREAREALQDVGLDINRCSWDDVLSRSR